jgi:hypothetical protein
LILLFDIFNLDRYSRTMSIESGEEEDRNFYEENIGTIPFTFIGRLIFFGFLELLPLAVGIWMLCYHLLPERR